MKHCSWGIVLAQCLIIGAASTGYCSMPALASTPLVMYFRNTGDYIHFSNSAPPFVLQNYQCDIKLMKIGTRLSCDAEVLYSGNDNTEYVLEFRLPVPEAQMSIDGDSYRYTFENREVKRTLHNGMLLKISARLPETIANSTTLYDLKVPSTPVMYGNWPNANIGAGVLWCKITIDSTDDYQIGYFAARAGELQLFEDLVITRNSDITHYYLRTKGQCPSILLDQRKE